MMVLAVVVQAVDAADCDVVVTIRVAMCHATAAALFRLRPSNCSEKFVGGVLEASFPREAAR
jgi:hypothetical protein